MEHELPPRRMPGRVPGVLVMKVIGETIRELEDVGVVEEGLVAAEKRVLLKARRAQVESERGCLPSHASAGTPSAQVSTAVRMASSW